MCCSLRGNATNYLKEVTDTVLLTTDYNLCNGLNHRQYQNLLEVEPECNHLYCSIVRWPSITVFLLRTEADIFMTDETKTLDTVI